VNDEGFAAFYQSEFAVQVRRAGILTGSSETAHDVVHDAMVEVYRRWDTLDMPGAYLNRAVLNGCHQSGRNTSAQRRLAARLMDNGPQPVVSEILDDVLATLPFRHRAAVVLRYYGDMSTAEIAAALDCAPGSVGPWIDRALKKLRKALQ
jgi:RNA polymerase sigma factor (sigma-70 family)